MDYDATTVSLPFPPGVRYKRLDVLPAHMSVAGNCEICVTGNVADTCGRCAQLVCEEHFETDSGLCVECVADVGSPGRGRQSTDGVDGVDTYQF